jgi:hypothetical protein
MTVATPQCIPTADLTSHVVGSNSDSRAHDALADVPARYRTETGSLDLEQLAQDQRHARQQVLLNAIQRLRAWWSR